VHTKCYEVIALAQVKVFLLLSIMKNIGRFRLVLLISIIYSLPVCVLADTTEVHIELKLIGKDEIKVKVYPPIEKTEWAYLIPGIIPGTYLSVNYHRFYDRFTAFSKSGNKLKVKRQGNRITIDGKGSVVDYLEFYVRQSIGDKNIEDNAFNCAGTLFSHESYLLNFQLITGYFDGYDQTPFKIVFHKEKALFGAGSMHCMERSNSKDIFTSPDYDSVIDQPLLYAPADTTSFNIGDNRFKIAIHAENGLINIDGLKNGLETTMKRVNSFMEFQTKQDYHFLFYFIGLNKIKDRSFRFGLGSALEHRYSSLYYYSDNTYYAPDFRDFSHIATHEYLHTIAPLNLHSEMIREFDYLNPNMSRHLWLYEGVTDYLATLFNTNMDTLMIEHIQTALEFVGNYGQPSLTSSSLGIASNTQGEFSDRINELQNFYQRGKLIAFALDIEIIQNSGGQRNLLSVLLNMSKIYQEKPFQDEEFFQDFIRVSEVELTDFFEKYVVGDQIIPFEDYAKLLGWRLIESGDKTSCFGQYFNIPFNYDRQKYFVQNVGENSLGLIKGDIINTINGKQADLNYAHNHGLSLELNSLAHNVPEIILKVERAGNSKYLQGIQGYFTLEKPRILINPKLTNEQIQFREAFFVRTK
jgi:predicted metalloprotease with PDZ domain